MMTKPRYFVLRRSGRPDPLWKRLCRRLDCSPLELALVLPCCLYVGRLFVIMLVHMATGVWMQ